MCGAPRAVKMGIDRRISAFQVTNMRFQQAPEQKGGDGEGALPRQRLGRLLERGQRETARRGCPVLVSLITAVPRQDPLGLFARAPAGERAFWERPREGFYIVAAGAAHSLIVSGRDRFAQIAAAWRSLVAPAVVESVADCPLVGPVCLGGFAFDPESKSADRWQDYPDALLVVPRLLFISRGGASWLAVNAMATPDLDAAAAVDEAARDLSDLQSEGLAEERPEPAMAPLKEKARDDGRWREALRAVLGEIRRGVIEKLVVAREVRVESPEAWDPLPVIARLRAGYRDCTVFAFSRAESCFAGATPERLVRLDGRQVQATCLAGSRGRGDSQDEDRRLGEELLADRKERYEHALVVEALREALGPLCSRLEIPLAPTLLRMPNVQHLHTPVAGVLAVEADILDLVARLHPTPAAGGVPREAALSLIRAYEPFDRGWYAGPLGWLDGRGGGEFAVAIRSALLRGNEAFLYAGCGIVSDSDPDLEYEESCLKLQPMLWALNGR